MEFFSGYSGGQFLFFYGIMLVTSVMAGIWMPAFLRPEGRRASVSDMEDIAVLSGGDERHATAVLSSLFAKDALDQSGKTHLRVKRRLAGETEAEKAVLRKSGDFTLKEALIALEPHAERIEERLIREGLVMTGGEHWRLRLLSVLPYVVLFAIGLYRQQAGAALGEPTGFLIGFLILTGLFAIISLVNVNRRTKAGNLALRDLERESSRLKRAPQPIEAGLAVAIFGTAVLVGTPWEPLHAVQRASSGGGDGGSSDDSGGDSGCGGGGCGGCGG